MSEADTKHSTSPDDVSKEFNLVTFNLEGGQENEQLTDTVRASLVFRIKAIQEFPNHSHVYIGVPDKYQSLTVQHSAEKAKTMVQEALGL